MMFFDTETTSLLDNREIVEIAILHNNINTHLYFNPIQEIDIEAMDIHNLTKEFLQNHPHLTTIHQKQIESIIHNSTYLIAHNAQFDLKSLLNHNILIPEDKKIIDTLKVTKYLFDLPKYNLNYLRYYFKLPSSHISHITPHSALSDIKILEDLLNYLIEYVKISHQTLSEQQILNRFSEISKEPSIIHTLRFGKYKGQPLQNVIQQDPQYITWLLEKSDIDQDIKNSIHHHQQIN